MTATQTTREPIITRRLDNTMTLRAKILVFAAAVLGLALLPGGEAHAQDAYYKHGDRVSVNGRSFTLSAMAKGAPYVSRVANSQCAPVSCTADHPYIYGVLRAYWQPDPTPFKVTDNYKHGDQVILNGKTFTLTATAQGAPYVSRVAGSQCAPVSCTAGQPYVNGVLRAYWQP